MKLELPHDDARLSGATISPEKSGKMLEVYKDAVLNWKSDIAESIDTSNIPKEMRLKTFFSIITEMNIKFDRLAILESRRKKIQS
jgi:hypothetical protein